MINAPLDPSIPPAIASRQRLLALIRGYRISQAIYVVTQLAIPDLLANGPRDVDELALTTGTHAPSLRRVLCALAGAGVLEKIGARRFALTAIGERLRTDVPGSLRPGVLLWLDQSHWHPWAHLLHTVRTGENAFYHTHGAGLYDYLAGHPEVAALFNSGTSVNAPAHTRHIATTYDFSSFRVVVDIGGGHGRLLAAILERYPRLRGVLFELPHVIEDARRLLEAAGLLDRCELVSGSFFDAVPAGGDVYILRSLIHDQEDDQAIAILTNCRRAMATDARLLLVEQYLAPDPHEALSVLLSDLETLVNVGGQERTTDEYANLLMQSGLRLARVISLGRGEEARGHHIIEAHPASSTEDERSTGRGSATAGM